MRRRQFLSSIGIAGAALCSSKCDVPEPSAPGSATVGGITFTITGALYDRVPGASDSGAFTYADLYNDFAYANASGGSTVAPIIILTIEGLLANTSYDLLLYSSDYFLPAGGIWAESLQTTYTPVVGTGSVLNSTFDRTVNPTSNTDNTAFGSFTSSATGVISLEIQTSSLDSGQAFTRLNGLELAQSVPEPSTLFLLGLGLAGVAVLRKKM